jgi:hypothetical protein
VFLGYSNLHKGFKYLDVATGRVYISRYVTFDEDVFPFAKLHLNAGAKLQSNIQLLPDLFPTFSGDKFVVDPSANVPTNTIFGSNVDIQEITDEIAQLPAQSPSGSAPRTASKPAPPESAPGSALQPVPVAHWGCRGRGNQLTNVCHLSTSDLPSSDLPSSSA